LRFFFWNKFRLPKNETSFLLTFLRESVKHKKTTLSCGFKIFRSFSNYFFAGSAAGSAAASAAGAASAAAAAVSATGAASSTAGATSSVIGASSAGASACLQDTTVNAAITAKLKNTFFILLNYKRLIINSRQRYKFFNMEKYFSIFFSKFTFCCNCVPFNKFYAKKGTLYIYIKFILNLTYLQIF
jgi:hypothetical protein